MSGPFGRVLITGISGSGGSYLAEHIRREHPEVELHGLSRWHSASNRSDPPGNAALYEADLLDLASVLRAVRQAAPDVIFHLASHSNVRASFETPAAVLANNVVGTENLLQAVRLAALDPVILLCSSSEIYGQCGPEDVPIREDAPLRPVSPYAVSKAAQDLLGFAYFKSRRMRVIRTRMFTYINPRRVDLFATAFARQIARIERGLQTELNHGNLDSVRTFIDVRDAVQAYWIAAHKCRPGEAYNIGGDTTMSVGDCLERLKGLSRAKIATRQAPELMRPADVTLQIPCVDKFRSETGWSPRYSLDQSLSFLLEHWRAEALKEAAQ